MFNKMNGRFFLALVIFLVLGFSSCQSSKSLENSDSSQNYSESKAKNSSDKQFNLFGLGKSKFIELDTSSVFTTTAFGNIKQQEAIIIVNPESGNAGFGSPYMAAYYVFQLDEEGRKSFKNAVETYLNDFENKRLERDNNSKTMKIYGEAPVYLDWGTIKASTPNTGKARVLFGYKFKNGSPFFSMTVYPTINEKFVDDQSSVQESLMLSYYMTKGQATTLVDILTEENINYVLTEDKNVRQGGQAVTRDEY